MPTTPLLAALQLKNLTRPSHRPGRRRCHRPVAGAWTPVAGCRLPVAGCRLPVAGCPGFGGSPGRARGVDSRAIIGFPAGHFLTGWTFVQSRKPPILTHCGLQHYTSIIINDNN